MSAPDAGATVAVRWSRSPGLLAGGIVALVLAALGLVTSRVDLALLAVPLLMAVAWTRGRTPDPAATATASLTLCQAQPHRIAFGGVIEAPEGVEAIALRCTLLGGEHHELVLAGPVTRDLAGWVPVLHSGPQELVRLDYRLLGVEAATVSAAADPLVVGRVLAPTSSAIARLPLPHRLRGLTGGHPSVRQGEGGDFRDLHLFTAGDRLRRIDWRATARHGRSAADLYVRRSDALSDATVVIVIDSRDDVGEQIAEWSSNLAADKGVSALDLAREAASSLAAGYLDAGDRVGFQDLSSRRRMINHGAGTRHRYRLLRAIELAAPADVSFRHRRPPILPPGALVYVLTSLLDDEPLRLALRWRGGGHRVIAVDTLPTPRFDRASRFDRIAHRMVMMERDDRIRMMRAGGIELLRWSDETDGLPRAARLDLLSRPLRGAGRTGGRR